MRADSVYTIWLALELNLVSFIGLMCFSSLLEAWSGFKYFIVQSLGSILFLASSLILVRGFYWANFFILLSLLLKIGAGPFQFWLVNLIREINWEIIFLLLTIQKVMPVFATLQMCSRYLSLFILIGSIVRVIGALNQMELKTILVYSSVLRLSWMFISQSFEGAYIFLLVYSIRIFFISWIASERFLGNKDFSYRNFSTSVAIFFWLVNMAGLPPLMGFYAKINLIVDALKASAMLELLALIMASRGFVYIYLRLCFSKISSSERELIFVKANYPFRGIFLFLSVSVLTLWFFLHVSINIMKFELIEDKEIYHM